MARNRTLRILIKPVLVLFLGCITLTGQAQQPYPMYPGYPYYGQPGQQQYGQPGQQPYYGQPGQQYYTPPPVQQYGHPQQGRNQRAPYGQTAPYAPSTTQHTASQPPRLEVDISDYRPYVQQTLILTLKVVSEENLATVTPDIPNSTSLVFTRLDGPVASARVNNGRQEIVNVYHYAVTPLQPGVISLPLLRVSGTLGGRQRGDFEIVSPASTLLDVQPVVPEVQPWLPLHGLILQSHLRDAERPEAGSPITLIVDISAIGASGGQLPSFEQHLHNSNFHVYREDSEIEGKVSSDGRYLLGHKTETFTLVPQHGGKLQIPELRLSWWNVATGRAETSSVPIRQLVVKGEPSAEAGEIQDLFPGASSLLLWVPLIGLFGATLGFWVLAWLRNKRFVQVVEEEITVFFAFGLRRLRAFLAWISPIRRMQKVRQIFVRSLPRSFRLWFCVRVVDGEKDPEVWSYMLKFLANKHLGIQPQLPLQDLGDQLTAIHHHADPSQMRELMGELEQALYGGGSVDFTAWKRAFRRQLKPSWMRWSRGTGRKPASVGRRRLPSLNPN